MGEDLMSEIFAFRNGNFEFTRTLNVILGVIRQFILSNILIFSNGYKIHKNVMDVFCPPHVVGTEG